MCCFLAIGIFPYILTFEKFLMSTDKTNLHKLERREVLESDEMQTRHKNLVSPFCVGDEVARKAALTFFSSIAKIAFILNDDAEDPRL